MSTGVTGEEAVAVLVPLCPCDLHVEQGHGWLCCSLSEQERGSSSFCPQPWSVGAGHPCASPRTQLLRRL